MQTKWLGHDSMQAQYQLMQRHEDNDANSKNKTVLMLIMHLNKHADAHGFNLQSHAKLKAKSTLG